MIDNFVLTASMHYTVTKQSDAKIIPKEFPRNLQAVVGCLGTQKFPRK